MAKLCVSFKLSDFFNSVTLLTLVLYFHLPNMFKRFVTPKVTAVLNPRIRLVTLDLYFCLT